MDSYLNLEQFVSASQPMNALAYIFDGLHYGVSDFSFASYSMVSGLMMFLIGSELSNHRLQCPNVDYNLHDL